MKKNISKKTFFYCIASEIMIIILIPIFIVGLYNHPSADDYSYSLYTYQAVNNGANIFEVIVAALKTSIHFYNTWQGLYTSAFILALQPAIFGEHFYIFTTIIIIMVLFTSILYLMKTIYKNVFKSDKKIYWFISLVILFFMLETIPSPVEGLYWFNGSFNYLFFFGLTLIQIGTIIKYNDNKSKITLFISSILAFLISGGNHVTAFGCLLINIFFFVVYIFKNKKVLSIAPVLFSLIGFIINLLAPGTAIRAACFEQPSFIETISNTWHNSILFIMNNISFSMILLVLVVVTLMKEELKKINIPMKFILIIIILSYILIAALMCVPYKAMKFYGAYRVANVFYFTLTFITILIGAMCFSYFIKKDTFKKFNQNNIYIFIIIAIILIGIFGKRTTTTSVESVIELLAGIPQTYSAEMDERLELYLNDENKEIYVKPLTMKPKILFFDDITNDKEDWKNISIAEYYNKKFIVIDNK